MNAKKKNQRRAMKRGRMANMLKAGCVVPYWMEARARDHLATLEIYAHASGSRVPAATVYHMDQTCEHLRHLLGYGERPSYPREDINRKRTRANERAQRKLQAEANKFANMDI